MKVTLTLDAEIWHQFRIWCMQKKAKSASDVVEKFMGQMVQESKDAQPDTKKE